MSYRINAMRVELDVLETVLSDMDQENRAVIEAGLQSRVDQLKAQGASHVEAILEDLMTAQVRFPGHGEVYWSLLEEVFPLCGYTLSEASTLVSAQQLEALACLAAYDFRIEGIELPRPMTGPDVYICRAENIEALKAEVSARMPAGAARDRLLEWATLCQFYNKYLVLYGHYDKG